MKSLACLSLLLGLASGSVSAQTATHQSASIGLKSTLDRGVVSIMSDPVLSDGRLVFKVVALNPLPQPSKLSAADVQVLTAAGKPVALMTLDALIAEARGDADAADAAYQSSNYSRPQASMSATGEPDVSGISGASDAVGRTISQPQPRRPARDDDPEVQQHVEALRAAILQEVTVAPGEVTGGQLVTSKLRFSRKEDKALRVVVLFNGEQHEFRFEAPPAK